FFRARRGRRRPDRHLPQAPHCRLVVPVVVRRRGRGWWPGGGTPYRPWVCRVALCRIVSAMDGASEAYRDVFTAVRQRAIRRTRGLTTVTRTFTNDRARNEPELYHLPTLGIDAQGSCGGFAPPFCSSSIEMLSGERTKAIRPSRGGRLIVTPMSISRWHVA